MLNSCNSCEYLTKRPGIGNYFIYKCGYWGLITERILPQSTVISAIGKPCPFFKEKVKNAKSKKEENKEANNDENILDITV